ncbi:MAG: type II toxin-antitoxin system RelE/ParE family toxin [Planctomycetes bacterium]|nr:type II toxin-antitoxin system RelE/ParE family toxin [Planctomycetota bacterium]
MQRLEFLPRARSDFDESFDWYAENSLRAAVRFADAVDLALSRIIADSTQFASPDGVHRECPVSRYPHRIVYRIAGDCVLIVAIAHAKRRPGYWKRR